MHSSSRARSATVTIILTDGTPRGLRIVDKSNWSGLTLLASRQGYPAVRGRDEFSRPGVYLLTGPADQTHGPATLYIGQADNARERLDNHGRGKEFWTDLALFTSKDGNLNKAHVQYIESRLIELAKHAGRVELRNSNAPRRPFLSEADSSDAEAFLEQVLLLCPLLGYDVFEPLDRLPVPPPPLPPENEPKDANPVPLPPPPQVLKMVGRGFQAQGYPRPNGFLVLAGATFRAEMSPGVKQRAQSFRAELSERGSLVPGPDGLTLTEDYLFGSPSAAAGTIIGGSVNGRRAWKYADGRLLGEGGAGDVGGE